jgi:hypothetical protein
MRSWPLSPPGSVRVEPGDLRVIEALAAWPPTATTLTQSEGRSWETRSGLVHSGLAFRPLPGPYLRRSRNRERPEPTRQTSARASPEHQEYLMPRASTRIAFAAVTVAAMWLAAAVLIPINGPAPLPVSQFATAPGNGQ